MRERSSDCWVFWIHASSSTRLDEGVRELADTLKLPGRDIPEVNILRLVGEWLRGSGSQWLLVLDASDLEDPLFKSMNENNAAASSGLTKRPIDFLAIPSCGQTILTTRNKRIASQFVDDCDIVAIGPMIKSDAATLFRNKLGKQDHKLEADIEELVEELGCMALAIAHAAAFVKSKVPPCPIQEYLAKLRESIKSDASLLTTNFHELRRDLEANNSAIVTWQVSFEHIRQVRLSAADLLSLMSFFDHRSIPRFLIRLGSSSIPDCPLTLSALSTKDPEAGDSVLEASTDRELDDDIRILHDFLLISAEVGTGNLEIHPLVQLSARKWLESHGKRDEWSSRSIQTLRSALPKILPETLSRTLPRWRMLYPHVELAFDHHPQNGVSKLCQIDLLLEASRFMIGQGNNEKTEILERRCWVERKHHLGEEHPDTLKSEKNLGDTLMSLGRFEDSFAIHQHLLGIVERQFESDSSKRAFLAGCLESIGKLSRKRGQILESETHLRRALELIKDSPEGLIPLECIDNLAKSLLQQGKHVEAKAMCQQLLAQCNERHGSDHFEIMRATTILADVFVENGELDEASEMYKQALETSVRIYGHGSIETGLAMLDLGQLLCKQKNMREAASLYGRIVETYHKSAGEEHPLTLIAAANHAYALKGYNEHDQALDTMKLCAALSRQALGPDHVDTIKRTHTAKEWERELRDAEGPRAVERTQDAEMPLISRKKTWRRRKRDRCVLQ